ncbi:MAG: hypothetical protein ABEJ92_06580 [Halobacteriales archaeon]
MSRALKLSGFVGLTVQMLWGMANVVNIMQGHPIPSEIMGAAHAHFGVLSLAVVVAGFAVDRYDLRGGRRTLTVWGLILGQWLMPATILGELVSQALLLLMFLWGILLFLGMGSIALAIYQQG